MKNYKKIRQDAYMYGFTLTGLIVFTVISLISILSLLVGISLLKVVIVLILIGIAFLISKHIISNPKVQSYFFDNKLPKKFSKYE